MEELKIFHRIIANAILYCHCERSAAISFLIFPQLLTIGQKLHLRFTANLTFVKRKLNFYPKGKNFTLLIVRFKNAQLPTRLSAWL